MIKAKHDHARRDPIGYFFGELGIPRLRDILRDGRLMSPPEGRYWDVSRSDEDIEGYCRIAAVTVAGIGMPMKNGEDAQHLFVEWLIQALSCVCCGEGPLYVDLGDNMPGIRGEDGEVTPVDAPMLSHWEWLLELITRKESAALFLAQAPAHLRAPAESNATARKFEQVVGLEVGTLGD